MVFTLLFSPFFKENDENVLIFGKKIWEPWVKAINFKDHIHQLKMSPRQFKFIFASTHVLCDFFNRENLILQIQPKI